MSKYFFFFLFALSALFADKNGMIILSKGKVHDGDYFVRGSTVEISGTVNGDLYVLGGQVFIDGTVKGSVLLAGGSTNIEGLIEQNLRMVAGQLVLSGSVGGSATLLAGTIKFLPSAKVENSVVALGGNVDLSGNIGDGLYVGASSLRLADSVKGNVKTYVNKLRVSSNANIDGKLEYWSSSKAEISDQAQVKGGVIHHPSFFYTAMQNKFIKSLRFGSKLLPLIMNFLYSLVLGLIFDALFFRKMWKGH